MKKYILMLVMLLGLSLAFQACGGESDDNNDDPTPPTASYKLSEIFDFIYIASPGTSSGSTGQNYPPIHPHWESANSNIIVYDINPSVNTVVICPFISEKMGDNWELTKMQFKHDGITYNDRFTLDYTNDIIIEQTIYLDMIYSIYNKVTKQTISDDVMVGVKIQPIKIANSRSLSEMIIFNDYPTGGRTNHFNGHTTSTESILVEPFWKTEKGNTVVVNLGEKFTMIEKTEGSEIWTESPGVKIHLRPNINSEKMGANWIVAERKFTYGGVIFNDSFDLDYGTDANGSTINVQMTFSAINKSTKEIIEVDTPIKIEVIRTTN